MKLQDILNKQDDLSTEEILQRYEKLMEKYNLTYTEAEKRMIEEMDRRVVRKG